MLSSVLTAVFGCIAYRPYSIGQASCLAALMLWGSWMCDPEREFERERCDDIEIGARAPDQTDQRSGYGWVDRRAGDRVGHRTLVRTISERSSEVADEGAY